jgi:hypothetical protein
MELYTGRVRETLTVMRALRFSGQHNSGTGDILSAMPDRETIALSSQVKLSTKQISSELGGEIVIMNLQNGVYHGVQGVSAFIWKLLAQPISAQEICDRVMAEYDVEASRCRNDVIALVQQLLDEGLVELDSSPAKVSLP